MKALRHISTLVSTAALLVLFTGSNLSALPLGTAFTYQGRLIDGTNPATGSYDLRFILYNADVGGSQVGNIQTNSAVQAAGGAFTTVLDFGAGIFDGTACWLEIAVRTNGGGAFTLLTPRQRLTPAPHALFASAVASGAIGGTYANAVAFTNTASSFSGNGAGLTSLNASQLTTGTVADARHSPNVSLLGQSIESAEITDGTIVNADISASAAIADTKLTTLSTAGKVANSATTATTANTANTIVARDASGSFSAGTVTATNLNARLSDNDLYLRGGTDKLHGLGWYGNPKFFGGANINGPVLYGNGGGALGAISGTTNVALQWDDSRNVTIPGKLNPFGPALQFGTNAYLNDKDLLLRGDVNHGLGWYGSAKPFASLTPDGPVLYGYGGGALGVLRSGSATNLALAWDSSGRVGIGKASPTSALDVNGTVTATAFVGSGAGLTGSLLSARSSPVVTKSISAASANTWTKIGDLLMFTTQSGSILEVTYNGRLLVGASSCPQGIAFQLTVDDIAPATEGPAMGEVLTGETSVRASFTGIFTGLSAGTHYINMWVRPQDGNAANLGVGSPVGWSSLIVKEYK